MTHCEETQWVASSFSNFFLRNNYAKLDPVEITSHIDKTVYLVNSATNPFKQYINSENTRAFAIQRCMRTQELDDYYSEKNERQYPTCFVSFGAYVSKRYIKNLVDDTPSYLLSIGFRLPKVRVRVSETDKMLINLIEACLVKVKQQIDTQSEKYSHHYGGAITGRSIKIDYYHDNLSRYKNIGYIIAMYNGNHLCGAEFATSDALLLLRLKGLEYAIVVSKIADLLPTKEFAQRRLADSIVAVVNLTVEGVRPNSSNMSGRILKKYLNALSVFGNKLEYSIEEIADLYRRFMQMEYAISSQEYYEQFFSYLQKYY